MDEFDRALMDISRGIQNKDESLVEVSDVVLFNQMQNYSDNLEVSQEHILHDLHNAVMAGLAVRKRLAILDEKRKSLVKPHLQSQKEINCEFKKYKELAEAIQENLKEKIMLSIPDLNKSENFNMDCELGSFSRKSVWSYIIEDKESIPKEYLKLDEEKIEADIKAGIRNIPGVNIQETSTYNFRLK